MFAYLSTQIYIEYEDADVVLVCGDLNARIGNLCDCIVNVDHELPQRKVLDVTKNSQGEEFVDFLQEMAMCVLNGRSENDNYTCISTKGSSVVDYIAVLQDQYYLFCDFKVDTVSDLINRFSLYELLSDVSRAPDHSIVSVNVKLSPGDILCEHRNDVFVCASKNAEHERIPSNPMLTKKMYDVKNIPDGFMSNFEWRNHMDQVIASLQSRCDTRERVDVVYKSMCNAILSEMDKYFNCKEFNSKKTGKRLKLHKAYWNEHLTTLWKDMSKKEKLYLKIKGPSDKKSQNRTMFVNARSLFDKNLRKYAREFRQNKIAEIESVCNDNPKKFWNHVKQLGPKKSKKIPETIRTEAGLNSDVNDVLNEWVYTFSKLYNPSMSECDKDFYDQALLYTNSQEHSMFDGNYVSSSDTSGLNIDITYEETVKIITKLKLKKAVGIDCLPNEVLKQPGIYFVIWKFVNAVFVNSIVPSLWLKAIVQPIPKGSMRDPFVPINYRGISLLSCVAKTYTALLNERIVYFCEANSILAEEQNGFRRGRSCSDHLFSLTSIIRNRLSNKLSTFCAFIDMEKAFDVVDRNLLLYRLLLYGMGGKVYNSIKNLYSDTYSCIKLNSNFSNWFVTESGVRQGDSLSPTLFALYINSLAEEIKSLNNGVILNGKNVSILLYADDIVLMSDCEESLQTMLDCMFEWCHKWRLKLNVMKSNVMHFRGKRNRLTETCFMFGDNKVIKVEKYKYLGVILDEFLTFETCARTLSESAGRSLGGVINNCRNLRDIGFNTFEKMYKSIVTPVALYAAEIWGFKMYSFTNNVQNRAMRYYLGVQKFAPISGMNGEFGWLGTKFKKYQCIVRFWNRLIAMDDDRLTKFVFNYDYQQCKGNWSDDIKCIFESLNISDVFVNKNICEMSIVTEKLFEVNKHEWRDEIVSKPKLRTYRLFKNELCSENYLYVCRNKRQRSLLAQFRLGILPLFVETGRYINVPLEDRICKLCSCNEIEDECHFLIFCPLYSDFRNILYENACSDIDNFESYNGVNKFVVLMQKCQKAVSQFVTKAYQKRSSIVFQEL